MTHALTHTCLVLLACLSTGCQCTWDAVRQELLICTPPAADEGETTESGSDTAQSGIGSDNNLEASSEPDLEESGVGSESKASSNPKFQESEADSVESN